MPRVPSSRSFNPGGGSGNGDSLKTNYMTHCKLGRHSMRTGTPYVWLDDPMGISCLECVEAREKATT